MEQRAVKYFAHTFHITDKFFRQFDRIGVTVARHSLQTPGSQQRHVDGRCRHQQALVGTDIGSRLGTADMLLARLQGQGETLLAVQIHGPADDPARHLAHIVLAATHKSEIRPAGRQRRPERLTITAGNVSPDLAPLARGLEQRQRGRVDHRDHQCIMLMRPIGQGIHFFEITEEIRLRNHQCGKVAGIFRQ